MSIEDRDYFKADRKGAGRKKERIPLWIQVKFFLWQLMRRIRGQKT